VPHNARCSATTLTLLLLSAAVAAAGTANAAACMPSFMKSGNGLCVFKHFMARFTVHEPAHAAVADSLNRYAPIKSCCCKAPKKTKNGSFADV
jgi:hypothetical protein